MDIDKAPAPASRPAHGKALQQAFESAVVQANQRRADAGIQVHGAVPGLYVQFESQPGVPLRVSSLEDARQGIELVAVSHVLTQEAEPRRIERATVFVPEGKVKHFVTRFESYAKTTPKAKGERRHEDMLDPVAALRLATLRSLWTDAAEVYPADQESAERPEPARAVRGHHRGGDKPRRDPGAPATALLLHGGDRDRRARSGPADVLVGCGRRVGRGPRPRREQPGARVPR